MAGCYNRGRGIETEKVRPVAEALIGGRMVIAIEEKGGWEGWGRVRREGEGGGGGACHGTFGNKNGNMKNLTFLMRHHRLARK